MGLREEAIKILRPFAEAANEFDDRPGVHDPEQVFLWAQSGKNAKQVTVGDARRARDFLSRLERGDADLFQVEYMVHELDGACISGDILDGYGAQGWCLCGNTGTSNQLVFARPITRDVP